MFSIKSPGPKIFSVIFSRSFLPVLAWETTEKHMENFPGFPKYDAKHWANELGNFSYHTENPYQIDILNKI